MSQIPTDLKYTASHEWLRLETDGTITIGITEHAQDLLGDIVFVELPAVGAVLEAEATAGVVESVKAASDVYAPIAGSVTAINQDLIDASETANSDPYGAGWFFKLRPANPADFDGLLNAEQYAAEVG
ncbi:glycine cleavage system protein GcvH [Stenoxybacter acetivorans]|uniref:glycine cleavage system protein GcvH n=1 Tax=Stenoxybacter acetivorans TaxID=422441 RepID=UPI000560DB5B|nr:glycine cleavage system protein GcvH [Stenoxybacter acetivorans]